MKTLIDCIVNDSRLLKRSEKPLTNYMAIVAVTPASLNLDYLLNLFKLEFYYGIVQVGPLVLQQRCLIVKRQYLKKYF